MLCLSNRCSSHAMSPSLSVCFPLLSLSLAASLPYFLSNHLSHTSFGSLTSYPFSCLLILLQHMYAWLCIALFFVCLKFCVCVCVCVCMCVCACILVCVCVYVCVFVWIVLFCLLCFCHVHVCVCVCVYVCVCVCGLFCFVWACFCLLFVVAVDFVFCLVGLFLL